MTSRQFWWPPIVWLEENAFGVLQFTFRASQQGHPNNDKSPPHDVQWCTQAQPHSWSSSLSVHLLILDSLLSESLKTWCFFVSESLYTRLFCHDFLISIVGIVVGELTTPAQSDESKITVLPKNVKSWQRVKVHIMLASSGSHVLGDGRVLTPRCLPVLRSKGCR